MEIIKMLFNLAVVCCMLGLSRAQTKYCCMPTQWESQNSFIQGIKTTEPISYTLVQGTEALFVDGNKQMVVSVTTTIVRGQTSNSKLIQDFHNKTQYTIKDNKCTKSSLSAWTPRCIPDNATLLLTTYFGSGINLLNVDVYTYIEGLSTVYATIAKVDCTPVSISYVVPDWPINVISEKTYSNVSVGIKDPRVFNIPDMCKTAPFVGHGDITGMGGFF